MEYLLIFFIMILAVTVIILLVKLSLMHQSFEEISSGLTEKLREDTNTLISVSSSDKSILQLASVINKELYTLRKERLRLQNGNAELQAAVTNITHDIRTPLTAISGYLELLEQEELTGKASEYIGVIRERTENLKALTEELFRYTVINATSNELIPEIVTLNNEIEIALAAAYQSLASRGITPIIRITEKPVTRKLDRNALQRILGNILNNAVKYSDGDLEVSLDAEGNIKFSNSAQSLTEIEVGKLFDRFYTVENAKGSTGLGLSIAKLLTEKMGGEIKAEYSAGILSISLKFYNDK